MDPQLQLLGNNCIVFRHVFLFTPFILRIICFIAVLQNTERCRDCLQLY
jgi:hypothetical protein